MFNNNLYYKKYIYLNNKNKIINKSFLLTLLKKDQRLIWVNFNKQ